MAVMRSQSEIDDQINEAYEKEDEGGSRWPGMSYEQGVLAALRWVTGEEPTGPMNEDG